MLCIDFKILDSNSFKIKNSLGDEQILCFNEYKIIFLGLQPRVAFFRKYCDEIVELKKLGAFESIRANQPYIWVEKL